MALSRKQLEAFGIEDKVVDQIIEMHSETVSALKSEIDELKTKADNGESLSAELAELQVKAKEAEKQANNYKVRYEAVSEDFDNFKNDINAKETLQAKQNAYRQLLKDAGVAEKRIESVLKVSDLESMELEGEGFKDAEKLSEDIKNEWADFITKSESKGADIDTPPQNAGGDEPDFSKMTDAEYYAYKKELKNNK